MMIARRDWPTARPQLEALFRASFGRTLQDGYLDWRYVENPPENLLFSVERAADQIVASYSAFPVELACDGETYLTAMSMTTMTHPEWRGRGLFPTLAAALYEQAEAWGITAVWGFPNANSHLAFNSKLGWHDIYEVPTMCLDVAEFDGSAAPGGDAVTSDDQFALDYPDPPNDGLIRVRRSKEFLAWRYARNPVNAYRNYVIARDGKVSSYVVTKVFGDGVDMVDMQPSTPDEARVLLSHVAATTRAQGLRTISCWAPTHHSIHGVLERMGFTNSAPVTYFGARELVESASPAGLRDYCRWYLQMGDSDVF